MPHEEISKALKWEAKERFLLDVDESTLAFDILGEKTDDEGARFIEVLASVADVRAQHSHAAEQVTQALQGERLVLLGREEGWIQAQLPDGYEGWVREWHLMPIAEEEMQAFATRCNACVRAGVLALRSAPQPAASPTGTSPCFQAPAGRRLSSRHHRNEAEMHRDVPQATSACCGSSRRN